MIKKLKLYRLAGGAEYWSSPPPAIESSPKRKRGQLPIDETHRSPSFTGNPIAICAKLL